MAETREREDQPLARGGLLAVLSAVAFGVTTPLVQRFGHFSGAFVTAALLYLGAALGSISMRRAPHGHVHASLAQHRARLVVVAVCGALVAPACLAWGLQRTSGASASLLLNFEAPFTALLAWRIHHEPIGGRVAGALVAMGLGGACLVVAGAQGGGQLGLGAAAVVVATLAWACDNTFSRPLADLELTRVVRWKALLGACLAVGLSRVARDPIPPLRDAAALVACGVSGYGLSLRLYLRAQRELGAARTGSIFAVAPFVGALVAWAMGDRSVGPATFVAGALFAVGVVLHLTESHGHEHVHEALEHEHLHRHDDAHHDHVHVPPVVGEHSHPHVHEPRRHTHAHALDVHHRHRH